MVQQAYNTSIKKSFNIQPLVRTNNISASASSDIKAKLKKSMYCGYQYTLQNMTKQNIKVNPKTKKVIMELEFRGPKNIPQKMKKEFKKIVECYHKTPIGTKMKLIG